jgi:predicted RNase H-like nuclease (RuvC/YqgF family)
MEKYAKLMKGLEMCAGPDCCKDACPYYNETAAGRTCRSWLLSDAAAAIANEEAGSETLQELLHNTEAERDTLAANIGAIKETNNALRNRMEEIRERRNAIEDERNILQTKVSELTREVNALHERCQVQQNEINALVLKTDRPSACDKELMEDVGKLIAQAKYQEGRADALAAIVERCSFGGGCRHE